MRAGFTTRAGGVSAAPWAGLNLGGGVGDDPAAVGENRARVAGATGVPAQRLVLMQQCHGTQVVHVEGPWPGEPPACDAVVTTRTDLALAALVADCTPVLLHDVAAGVVGAVHAGRPGMTDGIVGATVEAMRDLGATRLRAVVGPSICGRCYEVPASMRADAARRSPVSSTVSWVGTPAVDVAAGVVDQLVAAEVAVTWVPGCSREDPQLYSYRRDGTTGRYAGVVRLLPRLTGPIP
ncbi:MAG: polyphenol oxidase family protein [Actinomycetota bacterium]|nr:polyphenol oxidase family protein [Actinomycetota bacterium]